MNSRLPLHYTQFLSENGMSVPGSSSTPASVNLGQNLSPPAMPPPPNPIPTQSTPSVADDFQTCRARIISILRQPNHERMDNLDPYRSPNTYWFDVDNKVSRSVSAVIKAYFTEPHANWTQTPQHIKDIWFESFAQKWHWDEAITDMVRDAFDAKATKRLSGTVTNWKKEWKKKGDIAKPLHLSDTVWQGLVRYWSDPQTESRAIRCSASRLHVDDNGIGPPKHTSGQTSFARRRLSLAKDSELPPILDVLVATHQRKDGTFVDSRSEQVYNAVTARVTERQSQFSPGGSSVQSGGLSVPEMDKIYEEVAPKKKGRIYGVGSIRHAASSSSAAPPSSAHSAQLETKLEAANAKIAGLESYVEKIMSMFTVMTADNPTWSQAFQNLHECPPQSTPEPSAFDIARREAMDAELSDDRFE